MLCAIINVVEKLKDFFIYFAMQSITAQHLNTQTYIKTQSSHSITLNYPT